MNTKTRKKQGRTNNMKTIKYNNKEYKLPFDVELPEDPTVEVEVKNRFTPSFLY